MYAKAKQYLNLPTYACNLCDLITILDYINVLHGMLVSSDKPMLGKVVNNILDYSWKITINCYHKHADKRPS